MPAVEMVAAAESVAPVEVIATADPARTGGRRLVVIGRPGDPSTFALAVEREPDKDGNPRDPRRTARLSDIALAIAADLIG